jgi:heme O synthase-like polyprenyltransferase
MNSFAPPVARRSHAVESASTTFADTSRLSAYAELAKLRIALMVLMSMAVGFVLGSGGNWNP